MRRILIAFLVAGTAGLFMWAATTAAADVNDPGSGCNDQVNGASCVPDPSDEGQDCEAHGANEDGNENHCLPTATSTTTVTVPTTTTSTATTTAVTTPPPSETTTTTVATTTEAPSPTGTTGTTSTHVPKPHSQPPTTGDGPKGTPNGPGKLAFTGVEDVVPLGAAALALMTMGSGFLWMSRRRRDS